MTKRQHHKFFNTSTKLQTLSIFKFQVSEKLFSSFCLSSKSKFLSWVHQQTHSILGAPRFSFLLCFSLMALMYLLYSIFSLAVKLVHLSFFFILQHPLLFSFQQTGSCPTASHLHKNQCPSIIWKLSMDNQIPHMEAEKPKTSKRRALLLLNCVVLSIGQCACPLLIRLYFLHGGNRVWFSAWLQTGSWPIILLPLTIAFLQRRKIDPTSKFFLMKHRLFVASAVIGVITGFDNYLYTYGVSRLPVSTSSLIIASQLAFTAGFAFLLVKQKFTSYSINAVILLTIGAGVLALHTGKDRPKGESTREYVMGFLMTLGAAVLYGFILPLVELMYKKAKQEISYTLVLEIQMLLSVFATAFCTIGMIINNDFRVIGREGREFQLGEAKYYTLVIVTAMISQCFLVGAIGVIFCSSSLLSGVIIAVLLPVTEILAVIFYQESFKVEKGVSLALSLWGFVSYFYGEIKHSKKKKKQTPETEMPSPPNP